MSYSCEPRFFLEPINNIWYYQCNPDTDEIVGDYKCDLRSGLVLLSEKSFHADSKHQCDECKKRVHTLWILTFEDLWRWNICDNCSYEAPNWIIKHMTIQYPTLMVSFNDRRQGKEQAEAIKRILNETLSYKILGFDSPNVSKSEAKASYKRLAKLVHPDKCKNARSCEAFAKLSNAYNSM